MSFDLNKKRQDNPQIPNISRHMCIHYMPEILVKECDRLKDVFCLIFSSSVYGEQAFLKLSLIKVYRRWRKWQGNVSPLLLAWNWTWLLHSTSQLFNKNGLGLAPGQTLETYPRKNPLGQCTQERWGVWKVLTEPDCTRAHFFYASANWSVCLCLIERKSIQK